MGRRLFPHTGRGKELFEILRQELGLPDMVRSFEVRFALEEPITVRCEYVPAEIPQEDSDSEAEQLIDVSTLDAPDQFLSRTDAADLDG